MEGEMTGEQQAKKQQEAVKKTYDFTLMELKKGTGREIIASRLAEAGMDPAEAVKFVDAAAARLAWQADNEAMNGTEYLPAALGGILGAALGGFIWGLITTAARTEYGVVAMAVGFLCGGGVLIFSGRKKGLPLQIIACVTSVLGILAGKYYMFFTQFTEGIAQKFGPETAKNMKIISREGFDAFASNFTAMFSGYDVLWVLFAVMIAWGMLKPVRIK